MADAEQEQRHVVAEGNSDDLETDLGVHRRDEFVAGTVSLHLERRDHDAQIPLELFVRPESEPADPGVQAVGTHDQIEIPGLPALERDPNPVPLVRERPHGVVQDQLGGAVQGVVDRRGQVRARDTHIPPGVAQDRRRPQRRDAVPVAVNDSRLLQHVATPTQLGNDAHPLGHVEPGAPEIDHVPAAAQFRRAFDQRDLMPGPHQPVRQRRPGDSGPDDENLHAASLD